MRSLIVSAIAVVIIFACADIGKANGDVCNDKNTSSTNTILTTAGINAASDIVSAVVTIDPLGAYKITRQENKALVDQLYEVLQMTAPVDLPFPPAMWGKVILTLQNGKTLWTGYGYENPDSQGKKQAFVMKSSLSDLFIAPKFEAFMHDVQRDANTASLGASIGTFQVKSVEVSLPNKDSITLFTSSPKRDAIVVKLKEALEYLELRVEPAELVDSNDVANGRAKFGCTAIKLCSPITIEVLLKAKDTNASETPAPWHQGLNYAQVKIDWLAVMDYGNYKPPVVLVRTTDEDHYVLGNLRRREWEKLGITRYGLPGHPISDTDYYKTPRSIYEELQMLVKSVY
ncbi:MAG: hypothetical protein ABFD49_11720 [Armatimonadota bacterium]|nr:hypothetical protein [bacterium]